MNLIEVLVSLFLLSLILLGMDGLGLYAMQENRNIWLFNLAVNQFINMSEIIKASGNLSTEQLERWNQENRMVLPHGRGEVTGEFPDYVITVYWGEGSEACNKTQLGGAGCLREDFHLSN